MKSFNLRDFLSASASSQYQEGESPSLMKPEAPEPLASVDRESKGGSEQTGKHDRTCARFERRRETGKLHEMSATEIEVSVKTAKNMTELRIQNGSDDPRVFCYLCSHYGRASARCTGSLPNTPKAYYPAPWVPRNCAVFKERL